MEMDELFKGYLEEVKQPFTGWDFSYISDTGRMQNSLLSWSYGSMAGPLIKKAHSILDMGTGGGELFSLFKPFPKAVYATEGYKSNIILAKERLEPLGVQVIGIDNDEILPFKSSMFEVILNKHEAYSPSEVRRIIKEF